MTGKRLERVVACLVLALLCALARPAAAQPSSTDVALAETLYRQGRELIAEGKHAEAFVKFAESHRLDPATGTLLNLAACNETIGKLASAWLQFSEALLMARRDARPDRVQYAQERIDVIEPKLSRLTIQVPKEADVEGLEIRVDRAVIGRAARGVATPVDPGQHVISASAPGKVTWTQELTIEPIADSRTVTIPMLEDAPAPPVEPAPAPSFGDPPPAHPSLPPDRGPVERPIPISVYVAAGATLALAAGAAVTGKIYLDKRATFDDKNDDSNVPPDEKYDLKQQAIFPWGIANLALGAGALIGAGLTTYLYLNRPERAKLGRVSSVRVSPVFDGAGAGIVLRGALY